MAWSETLKSHHTWADYLGVALAIVIGLSPWFREDSLPSAAYINAAVVGFALLLLAQFELIANRRWEELAQLAFGIWMVASPFVFGYSHHAFVSWFQWVLGSAIVMLALFEYRQGIRIHTSSHTN